MRWITRENVKVGRMACAWVIQRFIDKDAEFLFVSGGNAVDEGQRLGATAFHVPGSETARQGDQSSCEVMIERYRLGGDPALVLVGQIVGTADVHTSPWNRPEAAGLTAITDGIRVVHRGDAARLEAARPIFDALYAYGHQTASPVVATSD
jgi:hypothetical protein